MWIKFEIINGIRVTAVASAIVRTQFRKNRFLLSTVDCTQTTILPNSSSFVCIEIAIPLMSNNKLQIEDKLPMHTDNMLIKEIQKIGEIIPIVL